MSSAPAQVFTFALAFAMRVQSVDNRRFAAVRDQALRDYRVRFENRPSRHIKTFGDCFMKSNLFALLLLCGLAFPALADTVSCPDLAAAVQVGTCPAEEELKFTFLGYCSDNAKAYRGETDVCTDYQRYRKLKNVALWESADGEFSAYVSCDLPAKTLKAAKVSGITLGSKRKMTHLVCGYGEGVSFTFRTRALCKLESAATCASNPTACKAECK